MLISTLFFTSSAIGYTSASSDNWVEVISFNGTIWGGKTEAFSIDHVDWRINWSYKPTVDESAFALRFRFNVCEVGGNLVEFFIPPSNQIGGTLNINQIGEFYLYIDTMYVESYSIKIEQNIDSVPEFSSLMILPILLGLSICVFVVKNKMKKNELE